MYLELNGDNIKKYSNIAIPLAELGTYTTYNSGETSGSYYKKIMKYIVYDNKLYIHGFRNQETSSGNRDIVDHSIYIYDFKGEIGSSFRKINLPDSIKGYNMCDIFNNKIRFIKYHYQEDGRVDIISYDLSTNTTGSMNSNNISGKSSWLKFEGYYNLYKSYCILAGRSDSIYIWNLRTNTYTEVGTINGSSVKPMFTSKSTYVYRDAETEYIPFYETSGTNKIYLYNFTTGQNINMSNYYKNIRSYSAILTFNTSRGLINITTYTSSYTRYVNIFNINTGVTYSFSVDNFIKSPGREAFFYSESKNKVMLINNQEDILSNKRPIKVKVAIFDLNTRTSQIINVDDRVFTDSTLAVIEGNECIVALNHEYINVKKVKELI